MDSRRTVSFTVISFFVVLAWLRIAHGVPNTTEEYSYCGEEIEDPLDDYLTCVRYLVVDMIRRTAQLNHFYYHKFSEGRTDCYGKGQCRLGISAQDCTDCMQAVNVYRLLTCMDCRGSRTKVVDCLMRIEDYDFRWRD